MSRELHLTGVQLMEHKTSAYRDGMAAGFASAADALDAVGEHRLADLVREAIRPALQAVRDQAAELGVELTPWRAP